MTLICFLCTLLRPSKREEATVPHTALERVKDRQVLLIRGSLLDTGMGKHGASLWHMSSQLDSMVGYEMSNTMTMALDRDHGPETVQIASGSERKYRHLLGGDELTADGAGTWFWSSSPPHRQAYPVLSRSLQWPLVWGYPEYFSSLEVFKDPRLGEPETT